MAHPWRVVIASALLATGIALAPGARADVIESGEESESTVTYADVCAFWEESTATLDVYIYTCGSQTPQGGYIEAGRFECNTVGSQTDCVGTSFDRVSQPGEVTIDTVTGDGQIVATIDGCVIDVSIATEPAGQSQWSSRSLPELHQGRIEVINRTSAWGYRDGTAEGDVCAWPEASGLGFGDMVYEREDKRTSYVAPDYTAAAPVASVWFSERTREQGRATCASWPDASAYVRICGSILPSGTWVDAYRSACDGGTCSSVRYAMRVAPEELTIDIASGKATFAANVTDCGRIDLAVTTSRSDYSEGSQGLPYVDGRVPAGPVSVYRAAPYSTYSYMGNATGSACGWAETIKRGSGNVQSWGYVDDVTTIEPALPA